MKKYIIILATVVMCSNTLFSQSNRFEAEYVRENKTDYKMFIKKFDDTYKIKFKYPRNKDKFEYRLEKKLFPRKWHKLITRDDRLVLVINTAFFLVIREFFLENENIKEIWTAEARGKKKKKNIRWLRVE